MWTVSSLQQSVGKLTMAGGGIPAQSWRHASSKQQKQQADTNKQGDPELLNMMVKIRSLSDIWTCQIIQMIV